MARDYYYHIQTTLLPGVTPLQVIQMWRPEAETRDLTVLPTGEVNWERSNGPAFIFTGGGRQLDISVETEAHNDFGAEFEDFLVDLADKVEGAAFVSVEGEERNAHAYGREPGARTKAMIAYRRGLLNEARTALLRLEPKGDTNEGGVLDLIVVLKDLLQEAIDVHIYANDDSRPADCSFINAVASAEALLQAKGR